MHKHYDLHKVLFVVVLRKYERFYKQIARFNIRICRADFYQQDARYSGKSKTVARIRAARLTATHPRF